MKYIPKPKITKISTRMQKYKRLNIIFLEWNLEKQPTSLERDRKDLSNDINNSQIRDWMLRICPPKCKTIPLTLTTKKAIRDRTYLSNDINNFQIRDWMVRICPPKRKTTPLTLILPMSSELQPSKDRPWDTVREPWRLFSMGWSRMIEALNGQNKGVSKVLLGFTCTSRANGVDDSMPRLVVSKLCNDAPMNWGTLWVLASSKVFVLNQTQCDLLKMR